MIIGFGPAGQQVAAALEQEGFSSEIIELNPASASKAADKKLAVHIGDASSGDLLAHSGIRDAGLVVLTVPDPRTARNIVKTVRQLSPDAFIIARSRYHIANADLINAGADVTVDEEQTVGVNLAYAALHRLRESNRDALACALAGERPDPVEP